MQKPWISREFKVPETVEINDMAWSPDAKQIAVSCTDASIRIWRTDTNVNWAHRIRFTTFQEEKALHAIAWNPGGTRIHVSTGTGQVAYIKSYTKNRKIRFCLDSVQGIHSLVWNPTGAQMYNKNNWGTLRLMDIHNVPITSIAVSWNGYHVAVGFANGEHWVFMIDTGSTSFLKWHDHGNEVTGIAFVPGESAIITTSLDGTARLYKIPGDAFLHERSTEVKVPVCERIFQHPQPITGVSFSPDGACFVTACDDCCARIWNHNTGGCLQIINLPDGPADRVLWSPRGNSIATCHRKAIHIWSPAENPLKEFIKECLQEESRKISELASTD